MALKKAVDFKGYRPDFWAIVAVQDNIFEMKTRATVGLYKDQATFEQDNRQTITTLDFELPGINLTRAQIEPLIMTINPVGQEKAGVILFADAQVIEDPTTPKP